MRRFSRCPKNFEEGLRVFSDMKNMVVIAVTLLASISGMAGAQNVKMADRVDSVSYSLGYLSSRCLMRIDSEKMHSAPAVVEYIEGLRDSDLGKKTVITRKALCLWHTDMAGLFADGRASAPEIPLSVPDMVEGLADGMWHRFRRMNIAESEDFIASHPAECMKCERDTAVIKLYSYALGLRASREIGLDGDAADYSAGVRFGAAGSGGDSAVSPKKSGLPASVRGIGRFIGDNMDDVARRKGIILSKSVFIEGAKAGLGVGERLMPETEPLDYIRRLYFLETGR